MADYYYAKTTFSYLTWMWGYKQSWNNSAISISNHEINKFTFKKFQLNWLNREPHHRKKDELVWSVYMKLTLPIVGNNFVEIWTIVYEYSQSMDNDKEIFHIS